MGQPIIPIGPAKPHTSDKLDRPMASQIGPEAIGPGPRLGSGRPIPILKKKTSLHILSSSIYSFSLHSKWEKTKICKGIFAKVCYHGVTWHVMSASDACVARLGSQMKHLTEFEDPDV